MIKMNRKTRWLTFFVIIGCILSLIVLLSFNNGSKFQLSEDDHLLVEREILKFIPIGSNTEKLEKVMYYNGFLLEDRNGNSWEFRKDDSIWLLYQGRVWFVDFDIKNNKVSGVKVWIQPSQNKGFF